ncbi:transcriptional regulator, AraC family [Mariniphaga anaerophila]|uniref:Transcriptional regulator, AraC family n=1 Tax=Mariniphaga anaerophila TaxID=1484053 RepID=A0A1M5BAM8_9BACT|nr:AraC family transcriptional regulator [Mariniphaga anaerophila]SHF39549.1 transcriptional regulator, AraC family [Mariniphaga anaerophila]
MKVMQEYIDFPLRAAMKVKWRKMPHFTYPWHFHSEYEILYIIEGSGTSFVADNIEQFNAGDLAMLGSNLPHFWRSDEKYHSPNSEEKINYIVIQFPDDLFRESLFEYPEFRAIKELLDRSSRGIRFSSLFSEKVAAQIVNIAQSSGFEQVILLLQFLQELAKAQDYRLLAGELYNLQRHDFTDDRLTRVLHFLTTRYQQKVELEQVAEIAHLHPSAFCRFFKEKTGKSLTAYITDLRISYACKLLIEGKLSVSQVCFECGFNNLSNFNRTFKRLAKMTPTAYFQKFHE